MNQNNEPSKTGGCFFDLLIAVLYLSILVAMLGFGAYLVYVGLDQVSYPSYYFHDNDIKFGWQTAGLGIFILIISSLILYFTITGDKTDELLKEKSATELLR